MEGTWEQTVVEAMGLNMKKLVEEWEDLSVNGARQHASVQDKINAQYFEMAAANAAVANALAQGNATLAQRTANNAATHDNLIFSQTLAQNLQSGALGAKVLDDVKSAAKAAVETALATTVATSAPAQGTSGVAQGALQTQVPTFQAESLAGLIETNKALAVELAEIVKALAVIVVRNTGQETAVK